jgi:hypothetical protein
MLSDNHLAVASSPTYNRMSYNAILVKVIVTVVPHFLYTSKVSKKILLDSLVLVIYILLLNVLDRFFSPWERIPHAIYSQVQHCESMKGSILLTGFMQFMYCMVGELLLLVDFVIVIHGCVKSHYMFPNEGAFEVIFLTGSLLKQVILCIGNVHLKCTVVLIASVIVHELYKYCSHASHFLLIETSLCSHTTS